MTDSLGAVDLAGLDDDERSDAVERSRSGIVLVVSEAEGLEASTEALAAMLLRANLARVRDERCTWGKPSAANRHELPMGGEST